MDVPRGTSFQLKHAVFIGNNLGHIGGNFMANNTSKRTTPSLSSIIAAQGQLKSRIIVQQITIVGTLILLILSIVGIIFSSAPKTCTVLAILFAACLVAEAIRLYATLRSRVDRKDCDFNIRSISRSLAKTLIIVIILVIVIHEDSFGIGKMITNTFPWVSGVADYIVNFINGIVEEIFKV